ncbi:hypothetical protein E1B28_012268 [Marasmius oreades]|uniref:Uncharacterized protein n=1 Tax=Marasmius oreades TaxID=181124 RepID=A0A9P7RR58_9AGAR|nr:uncharacterized protein E1B28_012268 [Marasmius oreades]KAG7088254.1 hypothetical protein E1B28_012268 [Marasmius oreades]
MDSLVASRSTLSDYLHSPDKDDQDEDVSDIHLSDEMVFCITMEQLYRAGMKRPQFRVCLFLTYVRTLDDIFELKGSTDVLMTSSDALDDDTLSHDHSVTARSLSPAVTPQEVLWDVPAFSVSSIQDSDLEDHCSFPSDSKIIPEEDFAPLHESFADPTTGYENFNVWFTLTRQKRHRENSPIALCFGTGKEDELELDWRSDSVDSQEDHYGCGAEGDFEELTASAEEDSIVDVDIEATECLVREDQLWEFGDEEEIGMCISLLDTEEHLVIENECPSPCTDMLDEILE